MKPPRGFAQVASGFDATEISLAVAALEGAGFTVVAPGRVLNSNAPHMSLALGGVPIFVRAENAQDAIDLLAAIESQSIKVAPADTVHLPDDAEASAPRANTPFTRLRDLVFYIFGGVSRPLSGMFLSGHGKGRDN